MAQGDRLRDLQMGEAGHDYRGIFLRRIDQRALQALAQDYDLVDCRAQIQADVGGDLIIARTRGVQALAGVAHQRGEPLFDVEVHVLEVDRPGELAARNLGTDRRHPALDVGQIFPGQHADGVEHPGVGERTGDIPLGQPVIEAD